MNAEFIVRAWHAWAPATETEKAAIPAAVPKALQRRLSPLARAVFDAAGDCSDKPIPVVFSSAHGEIHKSLEMLKNLQQGEEISPTSFSLSVHNAIAGLFSMAYDNHREISVVAAGRDGMAPAFIEALGLLREGHDEVLAVWYDEPLPDFYPTVPFNVDAPATRALALRLALSGDGLRMSLNRSETHRDDGEHAPQIGRFIEFLVSGEPSLALGNHRHSWEWRKN